MKKVLIITAVSGFLAKFETENVKLLQEMGYEVHYASNRFNQVYQYEDGTYEKMKVHFHHIDIEQSPSRIFKHRKALKQLMKIIDKEGFELIHCHTPMGGCLGRMAGRHFKDKGIRVIYTVHGLHFYKGCNPVKYSVFHGLENYMARYTDAIVTINQEDYEAAGGFSLRNRGKVYLLPGVGIDMEYFYLPEQEACMAAKTQLKMEDYFFLLSVGEIRKNKNQEAIIRALGQLKAEGYDVSQIRYGMLGEGMDKARLQELAEKLNIKESVLFYGYQQDVRPFLKAADVVAFPSVREGLGMAALEALAMGVPVLAAHNRGTREYMKPQENGLVYDAHDVAGFADGIRTMVEQKSKWACLEQKKKIRESVALFDKSCSKKVMRNVYEQTVN